MNETEYDKEVRRRLWRMRWRKYGWIAVNPVTVLIAAHLALIVTFALLGWEE